MWRKPRYGIRAFGSLSIFVQWDSSRAYTEGCGKKLYSLVIPIQCLNLSLNFAVRGGVLYPLELFQLRANQRVIDLPHKFEAFGQAVFLPLFQFQRQRQAAGVCTAISHRNPPFLLQYIFFGTGLQVIFDCDTSSIFPFRRMTGESNGKPVFRRLLRIIPIFPQTLALGITTRRGTNMKATGIVRRVDDLGRIVIPKEIRRTLRIREGDPLQITLARWEKYCFSMLDLAKRRGW